MPMRRNPCFTPEAAFRFHYQQQFGKLTYAICSNHIPLYCSLVLAEEDARKKKLEVDELERRNVMRAMEALGKEIAKDDSGEIRGLD